MVEWKGSENAVQLQSSAGIYFFLFCLVTT